MIFADNGFRTRAASLLPSTIPFRTHFQDEGDTSGRDNLSTSPSNEKPQFDGLNGRDKSNSVSSNDKTLTFSSGNVVAHDQEAQRIVRTIPTWVRVPEDDDEDAEITSQLIPKHLPEAQVAQHNNSPSAKQKHKAEPGRLYDAEREWTPPLPRAPATHTASTWRAFVDSSAYALVSNDGREIVTEDWLARNGADYSQPWLAGAKDDDLEKNGAAFRSRSKRERFWTRFQRTILRNPMVPLVIRMIVWWFSLTALALGASIIKAHQNNDPEAHQKTSPKMAVIVDAVALVYIIYITYDEYSSKPLGLRSAKAKMRLIFLDLFFIVFDSANLSLAFEALSDLPETAKCGPICKQQKTLASVLLIALIAWLMTFAISVLRLMERVVQR